MIGIEVINGRNFAREFGTDSSALILNETAVKQLGFNNPINEQIFTWVSNDRIVTLNVIGVVKDFHFLSLHSKMGPFIFRMYKPWHFNIFIKLKGPILLCNDRK